MYYNPHLANTKDTIEFQTTHSSHSPTSPPSPQLQSLQIPTHKLVLLGDMVKVDTCLLHHISLLLKYRQLKALSNQSLIHT